MMRAVIIGNGSMYDYEYIAGKLRKGDYIVCADGGYHHAKKLNVRPDVLIGDLDSLGENDYDGEVINLPVRKDFTDSEICVKYVVLKDFEEILMLGFTGTRYDHSLTNILLLKQISDAGKSARIVDEHNEILWCEDENIIYGKKGDIVSIIPVGGDLLGVSTDGLEYPLENEDLYFAQSRGVSNVMISNKCTITKRAGSGVVIKAMD